MRSADTEIIFPGCENTVSVTLFTKEGGVTHTVIRYNPSDVEHSSGIIKLGGKLLNVQTDPVLFCPLDKRYKYISDKDLLVQTSFGELTILDPNTQYVWLTEERKVRVSKSRPKLENYRPLPTRGRRAVMAPKSFSCTPSTVNNMYGKLPVLAKGEHKASQAKLHIGPSKFGKLTKHLKSILKDYTFGVEFETCLTALPASIVNELPIHSLYDGSLGSNGREYATDILTGVSGVNAVRDICKALQDYTEIDKTCSLHVHFGNIPSDRESLLSLFILYYRLQDEILEILPRYVAKPIEIASKNKVYADRLVTLGIGHTFGKDLYNPKDRKELISKWFSHLFQYYLGKPLTREWNRKSKETPWGERTWRSATRYVQLQMSDILVNPNKTVEFRVHHPSRNPDIVINWILICASIINYANRHTSSIINSFQSREKITLVDVIDAQGDSIITRHLINYVNVLRNLRIEENLAALTFGTTAQSANAVYKFLANKADAELSADTLPEGVKSLFDEVQSPKNKQRAIQLQI